MLRFILWLILLYFLWRFLRVLIPIVWRVLRKNEKPYESPPQEGSPKPTFTFKDVKDADFQEIKDDLTPKESEPGQKNDG
jgi:hypothetical protein